MSVFSVKSVISITCPKGLAPYLEDELRELGYRVQNKRLTGVETEGTLRDCMRLNLKLRFAHRIHYRLKTFLCREAGELYRELKKIPWEDYISEYGYVSITSVIQNHTVTDTRYANLRAKDAVVDRIREKTGSRPDAGPDLSKAVLFVFWKGIEAFVYIDTSGESISRRGYKTNNHSASMQETLAAALIKASAWQPGQHVINPMCGSGTLAIEAALMAAERAPGMLRPNFGIKHIKGFDTAEWDDLRSEINAKSVKSFQGRIIATDNDPRAVEAARKNARTAGVEHLIEFRVCDFADTDIPEGEGVVLLNPPYGERLGRNEDLGKLYSEIGDFFKQKCAGKWGYVFTGNFSMAKKVGLRTSRRLEFYNSTIECRLLEYELY